ncbi:MAG: DUF1838 family protein [Oceanicaulis sp.]|uniref:hypothetical protein n=1 Tax=Glycocaulis sp. TaxID=1969725 RepID=UPI0025BC2DD0|nr:hypothetical protein [Glycocaulis sp.]MCC5980932.1 DUF1838 family protein [Oceanicaulis sp.]MCH8521648.1 hypothetical protein [Glycocaulis sp.]
MKGFALAAIAAFTLSAAPALAQATPGGFDEESFRVFTDARFGTGEPVYWYSAGTVRAYPSGEILFIMEGYDTARGEHVEGMERPTARQFNRKTYVYRDAETGEILREYNGNPVGTIAYDYQFITYELSDDGFLETVVEQGRAPRLQRFGPDRDMGVTRLGDTYVFTAPVFLDFPIPGTEARYEAWENYDFFVTPDADISHPLTLSWARYGALPAWAGGGPAIIHMVSWRLDRFEDVPERFRAYIEAEAPLWMQPPADLDEIRQLQGAQ